MANHTIIQKWMDELLVKGVIEPSIGGADFYSNVFVVPKYIGSLWPLLNLKWFHYYVHIPTCKMPTVREIYHCI